MPRKPGEPRRYMEIADDLRARVDRGEFTDGKLPTERALVDHYGAAGGTVRQALGSLRDEGVIGSRVGAGWFVSEWRPIIRNGVKRLSAEQWGNGKSIWDVDVEGRDLTTDDLAVELVPADPEVATSLGLDAGEPVWRRNRRHLLDGVPVLRSTAYIPDDLARGTRITQHDTGPGGVFARLAEKGHGPASYREDLRCRKATSAEVADLSLAAGAPVVELVRYAVDRDDRVVEVNRMILDASRHLFRYEFSA